MRKLAPARVSYQDDFLISYLVYIMTESLHISLFEGAKRDLLVYYCYSLPLVRKYQVGEYAPPPGIIFSLYPVQGLCYVHFVLIKYTCDSKFQTLRMRYPFQSTGRPISHRNGWSFRVYMIPLRDFVPEWNSRPGTRTGVNSRRGDSRRHDIFWWYHVNKYRAMRGNRSELAPGRKSPRCHVNTPCDTLVCSCISKQERSYSGT